MGQRSQIILITPEVKYGNNNSNDNKGRIYAFHNQWRYGHNAIIVFADVIKKLKLLIEQEKKENYERRNGDNYFKLTLNERLYDCILYAENHRIGWTMSKSHRGNEITKNLKKEKSYLHEKITSMGEFLDSSTDTNNGFFIIKVDDNLEISYAIINGYEEANTLEQRSIEEYLSFFNLECIDREYLDLTQSSVESIEKEKEFNTEEEFLRMKKEFKYEEEEE